MELSFGQRLPSGQLVVRTSTLPFREGMPLNLSRYCAPPDETRKRACVSSARGPSSYPSCTLLVPFSYPSHAPSSCTILTSLLMYPFHAPFSCTLLVHPFHAPFSCTLLVYPSHVPFSCTLLKPLFSVCLVRLSHAPLNSPAHAQRRGLTRSVLHRAYVAPSPSALLRLSAFVLLTADYLTPAATGTSTPEAAAMRTVRKL
eukprot:2137526-Prymnesium_polylepis.1